ncbi:MAG TPA: prolyl oligopeptidase family serine peptidase [Gemmatimonadales bacterium]|jgi:dipeptidyl aminopeptidase/acylaminoacyl peptidase
MRLIALVGALAVTLVVPTVAQQPPETFTLEQVKSYPFPNLLTAAATGTRIAWAFNEQGQRNIYVAEGPTFEARRLTAYMDDDGQELTSVGISANGQWVVYLRGGDHSSNWDDELPVNPTFSPDPPSVQIWSVRFEGGEPNLLGAGAGPLVSPKSDAVAFTRGGQIWTVPIDGASEAKRLFTARGSNGQPRWSPNGSRMAFVSSRGDHSFVGVYAGADTPIRWIDPSFNQDGSPRWSPDGTRLVFVRGPGRGGAPDSALVSRPRAWSIYTADAATGEARQLWKAPATLRGSPPSTQGGTNLHWAAGDRIVFLSYHDGWPHLYSIPASGGDPLLLTPGDYMAEYISMSADGRWMVFAGNAGTDPLDIDRRHVVKVPVDRAAPEVLTPGDGLEWTPFITGDGGTIAFLGATARRPPLPMVMPAQGGRPRTLAANRMPADFPTDHLVAPRQVIFEAPDGTPIHGTLFEPRGRRGRVPAVVYLHGGPPRQMLLGWHYSDYYSNAYALNQYLASRGFVVLSVNYRLGIGYGFEFHRPPNAGPSGASEYQDVKAAAEWLAQQSFVDPARIGVYGGSYGGYLTAMALGRDSRLFAAGVDIHGVHDWTARGAERLLVRGGYEGIPDAELALEVMWKASPVSSIDTWTSPALIIHADDDRNVQFNQSTDLVRRLEARGVQMEALVVVDDTHHMMRHANWVVVDAATAEFLVRKLMSGK